MKKSLSLLLVLVLVFSFTLPVFALEIVKPKGDSRSVVLPQGGPYVHITGLEPGVLSFSYGWNNLKYFEGFPQGYAIVIYGMHDGPYYDSTPIYSFDSAGNYPDYTSRWVEEDEVPERLKLRWSSQNLAEGKKLESGKTYEIQFLVRKQYPARDRYNNFVIIQLQFAMP